MFREAKVMFMYTETALHCGSGSSLGVVDLPIQREKYTDYPCCQASGIKGALREWYEGSPGKDMAWEKKVVYTFGPDFSRGEGDAFAGAATVTDARLVIFPVRSVSGVFAYTTSRLALSRLERDLDMAGIKGIGWSVPSDAGEKVLCVKGNRLNAGAERIVLEEYSFDLLETDGLSTIAQWLAHHAIPEGPEYEFWRRKIAADLVILPDNVFRDFVKLSTEIQARIRIDNETKTVEKGALFYEEALPSDSLLYSVVMAHDPACDSSKRPEDLKNYRDVMRFISAVDGERLQMGGDVTIGKGIVSTRLLGGGE